jgi:hypothetical protein
VKSNYNEFTFWKRILFSMLGNTAISLGCHLIADAEGTGNRLELTSEGGRNSLFYYKGETGLIGNDFAVGWVIVCLFVNGCIQIIVSGYVARVHPDEGDQALPLNYFLKVFILEEKRSLKKITR